MASGSKLDVERRMGIHIASVPRMPIAGRLFETNSSRAWRRGLTTLLGLLVLLAIPIRATADTITLTDVTTGNFANNATGGGGPFMATTTGSLLSVSDFITFCLEINEYFSYGGTYNFTLSDAASNGGIAGGNPDPISDATKWLYFQVISGGYTGFFTGATGQPLDANVGATFQTAIWYLENERTLADVGGSTSPAYLLASYAAANEDWGALFAAGNRVYAMNLTTGNGGAAQDQLAYDFDVQTTEVPEPASTLLLAGALAAGCRRLARTRRWP